jgi:hypothetical protein
MRESYLSFEPYDDQWSVNSEASTPALRSIDANTYGDLLDDSVHSLLSTQSDTHQDLSNIPRVLYERNRYRRITKTRVRQ